MRWRVQPPRRTQPPSEGSGDHSPGWPSYEVRPNCSIVGRSEKYHHSYIELQDPCHLRGTRCFPTVLTAPKPPPVASFKIVEKRGATCAAPQSRLLPSEWSRHGCTRARAQPMTSVKEPARICHSIVKRLMGWRRLSNDDILGPSHGCRRARALLVMRPHTYAASSRARARMLSQRIRRRRPIDTVVTLPSAMS